jgi:hypothetical protein
LTNPNQLEISWGNMKDPTDQEMGWIKSFGHYNGFDPNAGNLSRRIDLIVADLKEATRIIIWHHYLHRGRTMGQLPYWIIMDSHPVGVLLYSLPRLSVPVDGVEPMNILELARMWIHPGVQGHSLIDSTGRSHSVSIASAAIGSSLRKVRQDWYWKYPKLPDIKAVVSWADTEHHEGTIYLASNFKQSGTSGGSMHGSRVRRNGGSDQLNEDYLHIKSRFMYKFKSILKPSQKKVVDSQLRSKPTLLC